MKKFFLISFLFVFFVFAFLFANHGKSSSVNLKFSGWGSESETKIINLLIKDFESQNPNINVEFVHIPQNYFQKLHLLFASNLAPDVVLVNNYYAPKYIKSELFEDLTPYIKKEDFFEKSVDAFTFDNKVFVIPRDVSELVVYYNKDLFDRKHIPYPSANWTIGDFKQIAKNLSEDTNGDGINDVWGTGFETDALFWLPFLMSNGTGILSDDGKTVIINNPETMKIIQDYSDMANKENIAPTKSQSSSLTMAQLFLQERIAMHISGRWVVPKYRDEAKFDWDVVQFPSGTNGSVMNIDATGFAVSKSSKHKDEALRFISFMTSKESMDKLAQSGLIVPASKKSAYGDAFLATNQKPKNSIAYIKTVETGKSTPVNENYQKIIDNLNRMLEPLFLGKN